MTGSKDKKMKNTTKKRGVIAALISITIISLIIAFGGNAEGRALAHADGHTHDGYTEWTDANALPNAAGGYYLTTDVTISSTWNVPSGTTNLCLNGHGIIRSGSGTVVSIGNGATLNLYDCGETEHRFSVAIYNGNTAEAGLATVDDALTSDYLTFTGGYITGGSIGDGGGGVRTRGNAVFNMYGGTIIGNKANTNGGGIKTEDSSVFTMYGGSLRYNYGNTGGAIFVEGGSTFIMEGGSIDHNYSSVRAGAIFDRGSVKIRGGEIRLNYNQYEKANINMWGGVIEITGGVVTDNVGSAGHMSGIEFTTMDLGGSPVFVNNKDTSGNQANFYIYNNGYVKIVSALDDVVKDNKIGVTMQSGKGVFTKDWATYMGIDADPADYFFSENADYEILRIKGEARLVKEPYVLIDFDGGDDGVVGRMEMDILEDGATSFTLPSTTSFTLAGKTLAGWKLGETVYAPGDTVTLGSDDVTFTAVWAVGVTVTFDTRGGSEVGPLCILPGTAVSAPSSPTKSGYTFLYWTLNGAEYDFSSPVTEDITLAALWTKGASVGEGFESGAIPSGWTTDGYKWTVGTGDGDGGSAHTGAKNAFASNSGSGGEAWLIMPKMDLSGVSAAQISFWYMNRDWSGDVDEFGFYYRVKGGDWCVIFQTSDSHGWTEWSGTLPEDALTADVELGFRAADRYGYGVAIDDVNLQASIPHSHEWTYTADGNVITATCDGISEGTCNLEAQTLTITSESNEYNGGPLVVTVIKSENWTAYGLAEPSEIVYSGDTDAWTYVASVTVGGATASVEFTVSKTLHGHDDIFFVEWTSTNSLPTTAGNYYLTDDVTISSSWNVPSGTTELCLNGHGIKMTGNGSVFVVPDERYLNIYDCDTTTEHRFTVNDATPNGAGLAVVNDALTGSEGTDYLTFNGGYITGGNANPYGGGVRIGLRGKFGMFGGTIIGNTATSHGGGVCVSGTDQGVSDTQNFIMHGGKICYNKANWGGGIAIYGQTDITGHVSISNNVANSGGAGIELEKNGRLYMNCGIITDNVMLAQNGGMWKGGGVHVPSGSEFHISGDLQIKDNYQADGETNSNLFIRSGLSLTIDSALNKGAFICVGLQDGTGTFTSGWSASMGDANPADYFTSDNNSYQVSLNENGEAKIDIPVASIISGENTVNYNSFSDAVNAWLDSSDGAILKLLNDVSYNNKIILSNNKTRVLDLNGKTYTRTVPSGDGTVFEVNGGAKLEVTDTSSDKSGVITRQAGNYSGTVLFAHESGSTIDFTAGKLTGFTSRVIIVWQGSTVNMSGGEISGNNLICGDDEDGIVRTYSNNSSPGGVFNMTGGKIINNTLGNGKTGGAVYVGNNGTFNLSGDVQISGNTQNEKPCNVYLPSGSNINIAGTLSKDTPIGVTLSGSTGVFTSDWSKYMGDAEPADYFTSDIAGYTVIKDDNGELMMIPENAVAVVKNGTAFTYYIDFNSALSAWGDGCTLTLLKDVTGQVTVTSGTKTLDLNNHSITYSSGSVIIVSGGLLTICDNSENKTVHYYLPNQKGVATLSATKTDYYFEGGYVTGGVATGARGGGLRVLGTGSVVFGGGTLFANSAGWGGGLWSSENSSVTIEGTAAIIGNYSSGDYTSGGGIFMEGSSAVTMTGGSVRHNSAQWSGGGVRDCVNENTGVRFTMTGGEITGNYANNNQGNGFCFDAATTFNIGGTARIIDNQGTNDVFMYNDRYLTIVSPFEEGALIGVTLQSGAGTFTSGWSDNMEDADPADYFTSDDASYEIRLSGEEVYVGPHVHVWTYSADGNVITATCTGAGKGLCDADAQTLTITAEDKDYDGGSVVATATKSENWTVYGLTEPSEIEYSGNVDAGEYTASVTVGEAIVSVGFNINKVTLTITAEAKEKNYGESDPELTYEIGGLVVGDTLSGALTRAEGEDAGSYAITRGTLTASDNYIIDYTGANLVINTVDAKITKAPEANDLIVEENEQKLLIAGEAEGGTIVYALGSDYISAPESGYGAVVPSAKEAGYYYVWYKVESDENHNDLAPMCLKVTIAESEWVTLEGVVYEREGKTPVEGATITLTRGNKTVDIFRTQADGGYKFIVPAGVYSIVTEYNDLVNTSLITLKTDAENDLAISEGKTESRLNVNSGDDEDLGVAVGGLDEEAYSIREAEGVPAGKSVSVTMTVEVKSEAAAKDSAAIRDVAKRKSLEFFEISIEKTIDSEKTVIDTTTNVLEIALPYANAKKKGIAVYSCHGAEAIAFTESESRENGTFRVDAEEGVVYVYSNRFSTYAIGYTPYYKVSGTISLGSFEGTATVTLTSEDDGTVYTLENVASGAISFEDVPGGDYVMTVVWKDGATNTISMPITIWKERSEKVVTEGDSGEGDGDDTEPKLKASADDYSAKRPALTEENDGKAEDGTDETDGADTAADVIPIRKKQEDATLPLRKEDGTAKKSTR